MPNTTDNDKQDEAMDAAISALYQQSGQDEAVSIPGEIDDAILAHAKAAVAADTQRPTSTRDETSKAAPFKRRGWEIPASLAATVVICSSLYLINRDVVTPEFDTVLPPQGIDGPAALDVRQSAAQEQLADDTAVMGKSLESSPLRRASPAGAMSKKTESDSNAATGEKARAVRPQGSSSESEMVVERAFSSTPLPAAARAQSAPVPEQSTPATAETMIDTSAAELREESLQLESRMRIPAAREDREIDVQAWLREIRQSWEAGDKESAIRQLREFRVHFPDYSLADYCQQVQDLCRSISINKQ